MLAARELRVLALRHRRGIAETASALSRGARGGRAGGGKDEGVDDALAGASSRPRPPPLPHHPSLEFATPALPRDTETTALSWLRRRSSLSHVEASALFRRRAVRVSDGGGEPSRRVSASTVLPPGARLLVPRGALDERQVSRENGRGRRESDEESVVALARRLRRRLLYSSPAASPSGFCVVDKPSGVRVQGGGGSKEATIDEAASEAARRGWLGRGMTTLTTTATREPTTAPPTATTPTTATAKTTGGKGRQKEKAARLVHRLDAPVSGCLAVASCADSAARLSRAFSLPSASFPSGDDGGGASPPSRSAHSGGDAVEVSKTYLAIVDCFPYGTLPLRGRGGKAGGGDGGKAGGGDDGRGEGGGRRTSRAWNVVDGPLPLSPVAGGAALKAVARARAASAPGSSEDLPFAAPRATTEWRVVASDAETGYALLALRPVTGRRHQLRKVCAGSFGSPVVGDERYGATRSPRGREASAAVERLTRKERGLPRDEEDGSRSPLPNLMLYCSSLTIRDGTSGSVTARARPPPHFEAAARWLGFWKVVESRRKAAERSPSTARGAFWWRRSDREDGEGTARPPRRSPRAGRRPEWAAFVRRG